MTAKVYEKDLAEFQEDPANPNKGSERGRALLDNSVKDLGAARSLVSDKDGRIVAGNKTMEALKKQGISKAIVIETDGTTPVIVKRTDWDLDEKEGDARKYSFLDNRAGELNLTWDEKVIIDAVNVGLDLTTMFDSGELDALLKTGDATVQPVDKAEISRKGQEGLAKVTGALADRFVVPPFSVLDTRQGYWQERKRMWREVNEGLVSDEGRDVIAFAAQGTDDMFGARVAASGGNASIFDPVLCEIAYRWFAPPGGTVLDPFAGGAVRGVVASLLGHGYTGIDLRPEQVAVNRTQWADLEAKMAGGSDDLTVNDPHPVTDPDALTPVQQRGAYWIKRDDAFTIGDAGNGGKVRSCLSLAKSAVDGLVTAGSRSSPQVGIVAGVAKALGLPCRVHTPRGDAGPDVQLALDNGAERIVHPAGDTTKTGTLRTGSGGGFNNVIKAAAAADAAERGWTEIPFGMECDAAIEANRGQVANLPREALRLVVPVGSGMSLAGILWGLQDTGNDVPVVGVVVGADPTKRLNKYAPPGWKDRVTLVKAGVSYDKHVDNVFEGVLLDPVYEAKCIPHLRPGDCLWVVGRRASAAPPKQVITSPGPAPEWIVGNSLDMDTLVPDQQFDLVFSCPPYYDLEHYSDDPNDLSNLASYQEFVDTYREIIAASCRHLKDNRFAVFVVGEIRDGRGGMCNFVGDTVKAFLDAGLVLYNEAILINPAGSGPMRANNQFAAPRKLVKSHQNVFVFWKGDPRDVKAHLPVVAPANLAAEDPVAAPAADDPSVDA
jgi:1-aminocyclopropane-1-carboxylate deaminase/D-cysteine desulfhydrase-like pyridoxal-dependent ACC family enzyme